MSRATRDLSSDPVIRRLTRASMLALSAIALFSVGGQVLVQVTLATQENDSRTINIAGRQRMLSQRLAKAALELRAATEASEVTRIRQEISAALDVWKRSQRGLLEGDPALGLGATESLTILQQFSALEPSFASMLTALDLLLAETTIEGSQRATRIAAAVDQVLEGEAVFLQGMDEIVFHYDREAKAKLRSVRRLELALSAMILLVLCFDGLFVFRPTIASVRQTFGQLVGARQEIAQSNERLLKINLELDEALRQALDGILHVCSSCKSIRSESGEWRPIESYISEKTRAAFSHGMCPKCFKEWYPEFCDDDAAAPGS